MARYIELNSERFEEFFRSKGFTRLVQGDEVVFVIAHKLNPNIWIKCYTSIRVGAKVARECGADAIRIVAVWSNGAYGSDGTKQFGIYKASRTYRVVSQDAVEEKVLTKLRECYAHCTIWIKNHPTWNHQ